MSLSDIYKTVFKKAIFYKGKPNQINIADGSDLRLFTILTSGIFATKEMSEMCKKWGVAQGLSKLKIICFDSVLQLPRGREWVDQVRNRPINLNGMNEEKFEKLSLSVWECWLLHDLLFHSVLLMVLSRQISNNIRSKDKYFLKIAPGNKCWNIHPKY